MLANLAVFYHVLTLQFFCDNVVSVDSFFFLFLLHHFLLLFFRRFSLSFSNLLYAHVSPELHN